MTTPTQRTMAIIFGGDLLRDLTDPAATPDIPDEVRKRAKHVLRHYPSPSTLQMMAWLEREKSLVLGPMLDPDVVQGQADYTRGF